MKIWENTSYTGEACGRLLAAKITSLGPNNFILEGFILNNSNPLTQGSYLKLERASAGPSA